MMRKIVIDRDITDDAAQFHPAFDVLKPRQRLQSLVERNADVPCGEQCRRRVGAIVFATQRPRRFTDDLIAAHQAQRTIGVVAFNPPAGRLIEALNRRPATASENTIETRFAGVADNQPIARQGSHQMMELRLDRRQISEDIRMIELKIVQYRRSRTIVDEFRALIAERGIVLVSFDDKERRIAVFAGQTRRYAEVHRHATDQEARTQARVFEDPGQHRGCGRLPVRPGDSKHPAPVQHIVSQPLRTGNIGQPTIQNLLKQRIAARDGVADHVTIRTQRQLFDTVAFDQIDSRRFELRAHRGIDTGIAPGDAVPAGPRELRNAAHEGAADAENVNMHVIFPR